MKKIFFSALIIFVIAGCKKSPNEPAPVPPAPIAVTYAFSSTQNDIYTIKYIDTNAMLSTETINGNSWSKSIKIVAAKAAKVALYVQSADTSFTASGNLSIAVQDRPASSMPLRSAWDTYGMRGQIIYYLDNL